MSIPPPPGFITLHEYSSQPQHFTANDFALAIKRKAAIPLLAIQQQSIETTNNTHKEKDKKDIEKKDRKQQQASTTFTQIQWHPHANVLAILNAKHGEIYTWDFASGALLHTLAVPNAKYFAWKPYSELTLTVVTPNNIEMYTLPSDIRIENTKINKSTPFRPIHLHPPQPTEIQPFQTIHERNVKAISWNPEGLILAFTAKGRIGVYSVIDEATQWLGDGTGDVAWSPSGRYLACGSPRNALNVWDVCDWSLWSKPLKSISKCLTFTADSKFLLFSSKNTCGLKCLNLNDLSVSATPIPSEAYTEDDPPITVGGIVRHMAIDPHGERLIVSFAGREVSNLYCLNTLSGSLAFQKLGYVRGRYDTPGQSSFCMSPPSEYGALAASIYSSSHCDRDVCVQFAPLLFLAGASKVNWAGSGFASMTTYYDNQRARSSGVNPSCASPPISPTKPRPGAVDSVLVSTPTFKDITRRR